MNVNKWGPKTWEFLHTLTFNYPINPLESDKYNYKLFFLNLKDLLPCKYCRESYNKYIKYIPIEYYLNDRYGICYWLYLIHYLVNKKLNKENIDYIYVVKKYESYRSECIKKESIDYILDCTYKKYKKISNLFISSIPINII